MARIRAYKFLKEKRSGKREREYADEVGRRWWNKKAKIQYSRKDFGILL